MLVHELLFLSNLTSTSMRVTNNFRVMLFSRHLLFVSLQFRDLLSPQGFRPERYYPEKMRVNLRTTRSLWLSIPRDARNVHKERFNLFLIACSAGAETVGTAPAQTWALSSSFPTLSTIWTPVTGFFHLGNGDDRKLYSQAYTRR